MEKASFPFIQTTKLEATLTLTLQVPFRAFRQDPEVAVSQFWGRRRRPFFFLSSFCFAVLLFDPNILSPISASSSEREGGAVHVSNCVLACK